MLAAGLVGINDLYRPETNKEVLAQTDLLNEYRLIKKKVSNLSANKRRAVIRSVDARSVAK
jgi:hypothetical protein